MAITKQKKDEILENLQENFKKAKVIVFVNFHGLSVDSAVELRRVLREMNTKYVVAKKTLINRAMEEFAFGGDALTLDGEVAVAVSEDDPIATARVLRDFAKKNSIKLLGAVFESKFISKETVVMLANIPPKEVLLGQFVNVINSPIRGFAGALSGVVRNFVSVLDEVKKSRS